MSLAIHRERTADGFLVRFVGEFDSWMADAITQAILSTAESPVVVDVSDLSSLDSSGVRALVEAREHLAAEGKSLMFLDADGSVLRAIDSFPSSHPDRPSEEMTSFGLRGGRKGRGIRQA